MRPWSLPLIAIVGTQILAAPAAQASAWEARVVLPRGEGAALVGAPGQDRLDLVVRRYRRGRQHSPRLRGQLGRAPTVRARQLPGTSRTSAYLAGERGLLLGLRGDRTEDPVSVEARPLAAEGPPGRTQRIARRPVDGYYFSPTAAVNEQGDAVVIWTREDGERRHAYASRSRRGRRFGPPILLGRDAVALSVDLNRKGSAAVVTADYDREVLGAIAVRRWSARGRPDQPRVPGRFDFDTSFDTQAGANVLLGAGGNIVLDWFYIAVDGATGDTLDDAGFLTAAARTGPFAQPVATGSIDANAAIVVGPGDQALFADERRRFRVIEGGRIGPVRRAPGPARAVAAGAGGRVAIGWTRQGRDERRRRHHVARFDWRRSRFTRPETVAGGAGFVDDLSLAYSPEGTLFGSWTQARPGGPQLWVARRR